MTLTPLLIPTTGDAGSFSNVCVCTLLSPYHAERWIIYDRYELKQFEMDSCFDSKEFECLRYFIGDACDTYRFARPVGALTFVLSNAA